MRERTSECDYEINGVVPVPGTEEEVPVNSGRLAATIIFYFTGHGESTKHGGIPVAVVCV